MHFIKARQCLLCAHMVHFLEIMLLFVGDGGSAIYGVHKVRLINSSRLWIKTRTRAQTARRMTSMPPFYSILLHLETVSARNKLVLKLSPSDIMHHVECYIRTILSGELTVSMFSVIQEEIYTIVPIYTVSCPIRLVSSLLPVRLLSC
jgi:hypothetical protein